MLKKLISHESTRHMAMTQGMVVPNPNRCVQCGICSFNCPLGIDVRRHAWNGQPVTRSECLSCGECVRRCPRGVLTFKNSDLFEGRRR